MAAGRRTLPLAVLLYAALAPGLLERRLGPQLAAVAFEQADERHMLEIAARRPPGSGLAGLWDVGVQGVRERRWFRPMLWTAWSALYPRWGEDPRPYARLSVLLHLLAGLVLMLLIREALRAAPEGGPAPLAQDAAALGAALFFVQHPVHKGTVAWLAGQEDLLHAPLYLGSLLLHLRFRRTGARAAHAASLALGGLGVFAKEFAGTLGPVVLAWAWVLREDGSDFRRDAARAAPYFLFALAPPALLALAVGWGPALRRLREPLLAPALARGDAAWGTLGERLLHEAPRLLLSNGGDPRVLAAAAALLAVGLARPGTRRIVGMGLAVWIAGLLPVLDRAANPRDGLAWHYLYLPAAGLSLMLAAGAAGAFAGLARLARAERPAA